MAREREGTPAWLGHSLSSPALLVPVSHLVKMQGIPVCCGEHSVSIPWARLVERLATVEQSWSLNHRQLHIPSVAKAEGVMSYTVMAPTKVSLGL